MSEAMDPILSTQSSKRALQPLFVTCIAFVIINTAFVAGRLVSRMVIRKLPFWWDDFWVLPAYVCNIALCVIGFYMAHVEISYNDLDQVILNLNELPHLLKSIYALIQLVLMAYALTRYSILALYLRIFTSKRVRLVTWIVVGVVTLEWLAFSLTGFFMCTPVEYFWNRTIEGHCVQLDSFYRSFTVPEIILDIIIIVIPIPTVWKLKASGFRKWGLTFVFCIGTIAIVGSAVRLEAFETHTAVILAPSMTNVLIMWIVIEPGIYLVAVCLPAMHHVFAVLTPRPISDFLERQLQMSWRHPFSRTGGRTDMSKASDVSGKGLHDIHGEFSRLSDNEPGYDFGVKGRNASKVEALPELSRAAARGERGRGFGFWRKKQEADVHTVEMGNMTPLGEGIMVTTEVIVTQEERIADVLGF